MRASVAITLIAAALAATVATTRLAQADSAVAAAEYKRAKDLVAQGKYAEACPLFEASYKEEPLLGAQINMADCHEHIGKTATAWAEFEEVAEKAKRANDATREAFAREHAAALLPKLAHLTLNKPATMLPGLAVTREGTDVTALLGTPLPVDPGPQSITESAPGYTPWSKTVPVAAQQQLAIDLGVLEKAAEVVNTGSGSAAVAPSTAHVTVATQSDATVYIDTKPVGTGTKTVELGRGPHTVRVTAPGFHVFQQEIYVGGGDDRTIDVPLEREVAVAPVEEPFGPRFEFGLAAMPGVKLHNDDPAVLLYRMQIGVHLGRHSTLSLQFEYGSLSANNQCGLDMAGAQPNGPFDFGTRNQFTSCRVEMAGLAFDVRLARRGNFLQPWLGFAAGIRGTSIAYTPFANGMPGTPVSDTLPGVVDSARFGIDVHPHNWPTYATIGGYVDAELTAIGQEVSHQNNNNNNGNNNGQSDTYLTLLVGLRSTVEF